jgi:hypothetical protein
MSATCEVCGSGLVPTEKPHGDPLAADAERHPRSSSGGSEPLGSCTNPDCPTNADDRVDDPGGG